MTMDEVARKARLSRALLYVYFQNKPDLLLAICERALASLHARFEAALGALEGERVLRGVTSRQGPGHQQGCLPLPMPALR